uniref:Uncharacterized protein n=1 Tax=Nelumbo nucifera TaxID=4432 RepID=A0A822YFL4_NELNU|nr:TPA_asm: hypothetical protein HUJ06_031254 [Nelumbo nucifera]
MFRKNGCFLWGADVNSFPVAFYQRPGAEFTYAPHPRSVLLFSVSQLLEDFVMSIANRPNGDQPGVGHSPQEDKRTGSSSRIKIERNRYFDDEFDVLHHCRLLLFIYMPNTNKLRKPSAWQRQTAVSLFPTIPLRSNYQERPIMPPINNNIITGPTIPSGPAFK